MRCAMHVTAVDPVMTELYIYGNSGRDDSSKS